MPENNDWYKKYYDLHSKYLKVKIERDTFRMIISILTFLGGFTGILYLFKNFYSELSAGEKIGFYGLIIAVGAIVFKVSQWWSKGSDAD